jgi:hypothetical protein
VHAHLAVCADVNERAPIADVASLDDPYLAGGSAKVSRYLFGNQVERAFKARAAADFLKDLSYSALSGCLHL